MGSIQKSYYKNVSGQQDDSLEKVFAVKPEDPSSYTRIHMMEGENQFLEVVL